MRRPCCCSRCCCCDGGCCTDARLAPHQIEDRDAWCRGVTILIPAKPRCCTSMLQHMSQGQDGGFPTKLQRHGMQNGDTEAGVEGNKGRVYARDAMVATAGEGLSVAVELKAPWTHVVRRRRVDQSSKVSTGACGCADDLEDRRAYDLRTAEPRTLVAQKASCGQRLQVGRYSRTE